MLERGAICVCTEVIGIVNSICDWWLEAQLLIQNYIVCAQYMLQTTRCLINKARKRFCSSPVFTSTSILQHVPSLIEEVELNTSTVEMPYFKYCVCCK